MIKIFFVVRKSPRMRESSAQKRKVLCLDRHGGEPRHSGDEEGNHNFLLLSFYIQFFFIWTDLWAKIAVLSERWNMIKWDMQCVWLWKTMIMERVQKQEFCIHWWRALSVLIAKAKVIICRDSSCLYGYPVKLVGHGQIIILINKQYMFVHIMLFSLCRM